MDVALLKISLRDTVVGKSHIRAVVSEIPELDVLIEDNRFDVLRVEDAGVGNQGGESDRVSQVPTATNIQRSLSGLTGGNGKGNGSGSKLDKIHLGKDVVVTNGEAGGGRGKHVSSAKDVVASDGVVVSVLVSLNLSNNTVVRVLNIAELGERVVSLEENMAAYDEMALMEQIMERRLTKEKGSAQKSPYPQRRATNVRSKNKPPNKVHIGDWVGDLTQDLQASDESTMQNSANITDMHEIMDGEVRWRSNLAFVEDGLSN
ncbi:hypothetical protein V6N12_009325 [Hibiscus sabdariffa]|uniref:Uncharacterized protein n=1 Tax=Hibiscus sabdariffa TaxID=183260 RepID=A0ABR2E8S8_9ROSI